MTHIKLNLTDDEFMQLGAMAFAVNAWATNPNDNSFGRLALKLQAAVSGKATPGQMAHFERLVASLQVFKDEKSVDYMMVEDGLDGMVHTLFEQINPDEE